MKVNLEVEELREISVEGGRKIRRYVRHGETYDFMQLAHKLSGTHSAMQKFESKTLPFTELELRESMVIGHRIWVNSDAESLRMLVDLLNNFINDEIGGVTNCLSLQTDNDAVQLMFIKTAAVRDPAAKTEPE